MRRLVPFFFLAALTASVSADTNEALRLARIRFDLARDVALAKLYSKGAIEDRKREAEVVEKVRAQAREMGVNPEFAAKFFRAQIEASKEAQRAWQAKWAREGAPFGPRPDLAKSIRPKLDALTPRILRALKDAKPGEPVFQHAPDEIWLIDAWLTSAQPFLIAGPRIDGRVGDYVFGVDQFPEASKDPVMSVFGRNAKGDLVLLDRQTWDAFATAYRVDARRLKSGGLLAVSVHDGNQTQLGYLWHFDPVRKRLVRVASLISNPGTERLAQGVVVEQTVGRWAKDAPKWAGANEWIARDWRFDPVRRRAVPGAWRRR